MGCLIVCWFQICQSEIAPNASSSKSAGFFFLTCRDVAGFDATDRIGDSPVSSLITTTRAVLSSPPVSSTQSGQPATYRPTLYVSSGHMFTLCSINRSSSRTGCLPYRTPPSAQLTCKQRRPCLSRLYRRTVSIERVVLTDQRAYCHTFCFRFGGKALEKKTPPHSLTAHMQPLYVHIRGED